MGLEDLDGGEVEVVANERTHAVALLVAIDGSLIDGPFQVMRRWVMRRCSVSGPGRPRCFCLKVCSGRGTRLTFRERRTRCRSRINSTSRSMRAPPRMQEQVFWRHHESLRSKLRNAQCSLPDSFQFDAVVCALLTKAPVKLQSRFLASRDAHQVVVTRAV
jgi:hypothetical protein